jgi:hypothetical protein
VQASFKIGSLEFLSCTVADVKHFNTLLLLQDAIDHSIGVGLAAMRQMSEVILFSRLGGAIDSKSESF